MTRLDPAVALSLVLLLADRPVRATWVRGACARIATPDADAWGRAVRHLRACGLLVEGVSESGHTTWAPGPGLPESEWVRLATDDQWDIARRAWMTAR